MHLIKKILILIPVIILLSCSTKESGLEVSVKGFVRLVQENGFESTDRANVKVTLSGTENFANTGSYGEFIFNGLEAFKRYHVDYSKDGFGPKTSEEFWFAGDQEPGLIKPVTLYQFPTYDLVNMTVQYNQLYKSIQIKGNITIIERYSLLAFVNDSANVGDDHYDEKGGITYLNPFTSDISIGINLNNQNYSAGTRLFIVVYAYNSYEKDEYYYPAYRKSSMRKLAGLQVTI